MDADTEIAAIADATEKPPKRPAKLLSPLAKASTASLGQARKTIAAAQSVLASATSVRGLIDDAEEGDEWVWAKTPKVQGAIKQGIKDLQTAMKGTTLAHLLATSVAPTKANRWGAT
eukprot:3289761-Pyramimonas_sp.AAC.1